MAMMPPFHPRWVTHRRMAITKVVPTLSHPKDRTCARSRGYKVVTAEGDALIRE